MCDTYFKLQGLDNSATYTEGNREYKGDFLMNIGLHFVNDKEFLVF